MMQPRRFLVCTTSLRLRCFQTIYIYIYIIYLYIYIYYFGPHYLSQVQIPLFIVVHVVFLYMLFFN
jgi:hypothetical protein